MSAITRINTRSCRASTAATRPQPHLRRQHRPAALAKFRCPKTAYDGNGNVRALVKADAANPAASGVVERYAYDGFGRELAGSTSLHTSALNPFRFSTKQFDAEVGMNYYGYRFYAADAGRWINRDPVLEEGGFNVYAMVYNDAIDGVDVLGLASDCDLETAFGFGLNFNKKIRTPVPWIQGSFGGGFKFDGKSKNCRICCGGKMHNVKSWTAARSGFYSASISAGINEEEEIGNWKVKVFAGIQVAGRITVGGVEARYKEVCEGSEIKGSGYISLSNSNRYFGNWRSASSINPKVCRL